MSDLHDMARPHWEMPVYEQKVLTNGVKFNYYDCDVCVSVSGGVDSALLLYNVALHSPRKIHVYTLANNDLILKNVVAATAVVNKVRQLTDNPNIYHTVMHMPGSKPNGGEVIGHRMREHYGKDLEVCYMGVTQNPPLEVMETWNVDDWSHPYRDNTTAEFEVLPNVGKIYMPWTNVHKRHISAIYRSQGILETLFPVTYSCEWYAKDGNDPGMKHCENCWWCEERYWGFNRYV